MKWGLVLSGGGTRGSAHVGVLKALEENNIKPDIITGTSAGAIVAGLYSSGCSIHKMRKLINSLNGKYIDIDYLGSIRSLIQLLINRHINQTGIISGNRLEHIFDIYSKFKYLNKIEMPMAITAVDINTSELVVFTSKLDKFHNIPGITAIDNIKVANAIRASIAIPGLFKPKIISGRRLVDGGIKDNIPVNIAKIMGAQKTISVNLGYTGEKLTHVDNISEITMQALDIMIWETSKNNIHSSDLVLTPFVTNLRQSNLSTTKLSFEQGYKYTLTMIPQIKKILHRF